MKLKTTITTICAIIALCLPSLALSAQTTTVSSLKELMPLLKKSNGNVVMNPGTYRVTTKDAKAGKYESKSEIIEGQFKNVLLLIKGSNNTFDFTGVTIEVETGVFNAYTKGEYHVLQTLGNNNVIKNLKLVDVGLKTDIPKNGCTNVVLDGANNLIEGVEVRSTGSFPYGYGEVFGKGGPATIRHKKHCAVLVRGDFNHVKNCTIIHRAYGHYLFMQAAKNPTIEGCYIEGEMVSTDRILSEKGTGSPADKIAFKTVWGYTLPKGYTLSTGEDGIRTYNAGSTMVNGERFKRGSSNITVKDCTVKHARGGVALTLSSGFKIVENCTLIGCQGGFATGSGGKIINCRADATFGPVFSTAYERDSNISVDITIIPYDGDEYAGNGSKQVAMIMGTKHNITLRRGEGLNENQDLEICFGGNRRGIGNLAEIQDLKASNITITNETKYPIALAGQTTGINGTTKGKVIDNGNGNSVVKE